MKKIIGGKLYDTQTAKLVGSWDNGYHGRDFLVCSEDLYRKRTGEFFLHGEGGPLTQYASCDGNMRGFGHKITPLSEKQAKEWAETHLDAEEYITLFGEVEE